MLLVGISPVRGQQFSGGGSGGVAPAGVTGGNPVQLTGAQVTGGTQNLALPNMPAPTVTCAGACAGGTWGYKVTALDSNGTLGGTLSGMAEYQTKASAQGAATNATTLTTTNKNTISWSAVPGATGYTVYRTASAGTPANLSVICDNTQALSCVDDGSVNTASVTAPTTNSTGGFVAQCPSAGIPDLSFGGNFQVPTGFGGGVIGSGICFDSGGAIWLFVPGHYPIAYVNSSWNFKWSQMVTWAPNGTSPNAGVGASISGAIQTGHDSAPFELIVTNNDVQSARADTGSGAFVAALGYDIHLLSTNDMSGGSQYVPVKADTANANQVVTTTTTDTGAGVVIGVVNNKPTAGTRADIQLLGWIQPVLGTGTCAIGNFVIVDTTTNGRVKCTATYTAGTVIGVAMAANSTVGTTFNVLESLR